MTEKECEKKTEKFTVYIQLRSWDSFKTVYWGQKCTQSHENWHSTYHYEIFLNSLI